MEMPVMREAMALEEQMRTARYLRVFCALDSVSREEAEQAELAVQSLTPPADPNWIAGRIATLLSHYYVSSLPDGVMAEIGADWISELESFPAYSLQEAARWWIGNGNEHRRKKPLPGDISEKAREICRIQDAAHFKAQRALRPSKSNSENAVVRLEPRERVSPEAAEAILAEVGFRPRRFGQEEAH